MSFLDCKRVLIFSAHAADFCSRAGGTIARFVDAGAAVHVIDFSFGERCEAPALYALDEPPSLEEIRGIRKQELEAGAAVLGATIDCTDFGDGPLLIGPERRLKVLDAIRAFQPDAVLCHWIDDFTHPDHVEAAEAVLWAKCYCGVPGIVTEHPPCASPQLVCYEAQLGTASLSKFLPDFYVSIDSTLDRKSVALDKFAAQPDLAENYAALSRYRGFETFTAGMVDCKHAEGFCRLGTSAEG